MNEDNNGVVDKVASKGVSKYLQAHGVPSPVADIGGDLVVEEAKRQHKRNKRIILFFVSGLLVLFILLFVVVMGAKRTSAMEGISNAGNGGCIRSTDAWANFVEDEKDAPTFYNKFNTLLAENPSVDFNTASAILTYGDVPDVEDRYACNEEEAIETVDPDTGEVKEEVTKEECSEAKEGSSKSATALYKDAKKIVKGLASIGRSDDEVRKWLEENYIEDKLKDMGRQIPTDEMQKQELFTRTIDDIFGLRDQYKAMVCQNSTNSCSYEGTAQDVTIAQLQTASREECAKLIGPIAQSYAQSTGILPSIVIAQAIEETGCGTSSISKEGNGLFNIVASGSPNKYWDGSYVTASNGKKWRKYKTVSDSIGDHIRLLSEGSTYKNAGVALKKTPAEQIAAIQVGGYCADCPGYEDRILTPIKKYNLEKYDTINSTTECLIDGLEVVAGSYHKPIVYFNQTEEPYASKPYGPYGTIRSHGCGPTSMAIIVSSMLQVNHNPIEMTNLTCSKGLCTESGSSHAIAEKISSNFGLKSSGSLRQDTNGQQQVLQALSSGKSLILSLQGPGIFTTGGHFIVLTGITNDGKIQVADPASRKRTATTYSLSDILKSQKQWWIITEP